MLFRSAKTPEKSKSGGNSGASAAAAAAAAANPLAGMDPKLLQSMGLDPKMMAGLDPKSMAGLDPKMLMSMGIDPKMLEGMDPKMLASLGMPGMDPKSMAAASAQAAAAFDPKLLASAGLDPKMFGLDPKTMASLASMDPKELAKLDPALAALYGLPPGGSTSQHNGVSKGNSSQGRPKPGTVAAALEEKKKAAAAAAAAADLQSSQATAAANHADQDGQLAANLAADKTKDNNNPNQNQDNSVPQDMSNPNIAGGVSADLATAVAATTKQQNGGTGEIIQTAPNAEQNNIIDPNDNTNDGTDTEGSTKGGLTSEERVLLREKKKARLQKEQEQTWENNLPSLPPQTSAELADLAGDGHQASSVAEGSDTEDRGPLPETDGLLKSRLTRASRRLSGVDQNQEFAGPPLDGAAVDNSAPITEDSVPQQE